MKINKVEGIQQMPQRPRKKKEEPAYHKREIRDISAPDFYKVQEFRNLSPNLITAIKSAFDKDEVYDVVSAEGKGVGIKVKIKKGAKSEEINMIIAEAAKKINGIIKAKNQIDMAA
jgi:hypothetical protein